MRALIWPLVVLVSTSASAQQSVGPFVVVGKDVYFAEPPRQVTDMMVSSLAAMPGGRYALLQGVDMPKRFLEKALKGGPVPMPGSKWMIWDTSNDKVYPVQFDSKDIGAVQLAKTADPAVALATWSGPVSADADGAWVSKFFRVDLASGAVRPFAGKPAAEGTDYVQMYASPTKPFTVRIGLKVDRTVDPADRKTHIDVEVFDLEGRSLRSNRSTVNGAAFFDGRWSAGGTVLVGTQIKASGAGAVEGTSGTVVLDPSKATVVETAERFSPDAEPETSGPLGLELHEHVLVVDKDTSKPVRGLWLAARQPSESTRTLVAADSSELNFLAPDLSFAAYVSNGRLFRAEILKGDYEVFRQAKLAAERTKALSNVKQVALAALLFATDNKDVLPGAGEFSSSISPYLKNDKLLDGFVWTFQGGSMNDVKDPARTELGYITVPGGRCVAYVDGHAKFVKDP